MKVELENIENFFKYDLEIKKIMHSVDIPFDCDYKDEYVIGYADKLYDSLETFKYYLVKIINELKMGKDYSNYIDKIFKNYKKELSRCGMNFDKLTHFYTNNIGGMRESYIDDVNMNCYGYSIDKGYDGFFEAKTVNEMLHFLHHKITNNEKFYQNMPQLEQKNNSSSYPITLYGRENNIAKNIYDNFPLSLDVGYTDILSLKDKILLMIRDRGHALSIEINVRNNECDIKYFIPKVINHIMVNNLRGVRKVNENSRFTLGEFRTNIEQLDESLYEFIGKVPTDDDRYVGDTQDFEVGRNR